MQIVCLISEFHLSLFVYIEIFHLHFSDSNLLFQIFYLARLLGLDESHPEKGCVVSSNGRGHTVILVALTALEVS